MQNFPNIPSANLPYFIFPPEGRNASVMIEMLAINFAKLIVFFLPNLLQKYIAEAIAGNSIALIRIKLRYQFPPRSSAANDNP